MDAFDGDESQYNGMTRRALAQSAVMLAWLLLAFLGSTSTLWAQAAFTIEDFEPVGYMAKLDGKTLEDGEVYQSRAAGAFLILASDLPAPVMVKIRDGQVKTVDLMKVNRREDGTVELLPNATLTSLGAFKVSADRSGIEFNVDGRAGELLEKPPLIGHQGIAELGEHSPEYKRSAASYNPSDPIVSKLKTQSDDIKVQVFFGSWCGACKQMVPRIMKVAEQLEGSNISFDFYGLPRGIAGDPEAARYKVEAVPTGVVFRDGKEIGRVSGAGWKVPELAINNLLISPSS
jgi:thiol-disulfide isomerase/thioredoxin